MCGRFSFVVKKEKVVKQFPNIEIEGKLLENYNVAPTQQAYVITNKQPNVLQTMHWGLIPHWSKDGKGSGALINARMETIGEKPSFREPIRSQRCLVLTDSFYEWKTVNSKKIPYRIVMPHDELMIFGGIYDEWQGVKTFSILTTEPNKEMSKLHTRMPVILKEGDDDYEKWLGDTDLSIILKMSEQPKEDFLHIYRVSEKVNSVKNNCEDLHLEIPEELTLF